MPWSLLFGLGINSYSFEFESCGFCFVLLLLLLAAAHSFRGTGLSLVDSVVWACDYPTRQQSIEEGNAPFMARRQERRISVLLQAHILRDHSLVPVSEDCVRLSLLW